MTGSRPGSRSTNRSPRVPLAASAARGKLISERRGPYCGAHHDFVGVPMRQNALSRRSEITAVGGRHRHVGKRDPLSAWGLNVPDPQIDESRSHGLPRPRRSSNCRIAQPSPPDARTDARPSTRTSCVMTCRQRKRRLPSHGARQGPPNHRQPETETDRISPRRGSRR